MSEFVSIEFGGSGLLLDRLSITSHETAGKTGNQLFRVLLPIAMHAGAKLTNRLTEDQKHWQRNPFRSDTKV